MALALLAILSMAGAFVGARASKALFNAVPLAVFWFLFAALLVAGILLFQRLRRSPGLLAMHVGVILVLGGAMWGSDTGHKVAARLLGVHKIPSGYMCVAKGEATDQVFADDRDFSPAKAIGRLPFSLTLSDFRIEYYPTAQNRWNLVVVAPAPVGPDQAHGLREPLEARLDWSVNQEVAIPFTKVRLTVLQYWPGARPVYADTKPTLEIVDTGGKSLFLPAEVGQQATLENPRTTIRIVRIFTNLRVRGMGAEHEILDAGGAPENPALEVELESPEGKKEVRYVIARFPMHGEPPGALRLRYRLPEAVGAKPDPHAGGVPAMEVLLKGEGQEKRAWLIPASQDAEAQLSLALLLGQGKQQEVEHKGEEGGPQLYLVPPTGEVKSYLSDLEVLRQGRPVARQIVEVNQPLHYEGYQLYQHSFDTAAGEYTILGVTSDSGLWGVYAGFILLVVGAFWQFWAEAVLPRVTDGNKHAA